MNDALRLERVRVSRDARVVLRDVTLTLPAGSALAVAGASGNGKTTLLRTIAGLERVDSGAVWINGQRVTQGGTILVPPHKRDIGFVFQDLALWPHMTVAKSLAFVLQSSRPSHSRDEHQRAIEATLQLVHIEDFGNRYPHQLSGGEQQRAALARALISRPGLLLLDEPFSSLDVELREEMRAALREIRRKLGFSMLFVTHDRAEADAVADRTVHLTRGGLIEQGDVRERDDSRY